MAKEPRVESREVDGRSATVFDNGLCRAVIDLAGGMMPEFSIRRGAGVINVHYLPHFRGRKGGAWSEKRDGAFWKARLLRDLAGDFPCAPSFGAACRVDGIGLPPHGPAANGVWTLEATGVDRKFRAAWARLSLSMDSSRMPLTFRRWDAMADAQSAWYSLLEIENRGDRDLAINIGRHATLGAPFLAPGCLVSVGARRFMTPPRGTEFDMSGRLAIGAEFGSLGAAPLRAGGTVDLRTVPGPIGATDLVAGLVPSSATLGWSCVVNPALDLAHVAFFPGPAALGPGEVAPRFNLLWMQYGGRPYAPWAAYDGGPDLAFCLGTEHASSYFANGLASARENPILMGAPTTVTIPAHARRRFFYGSLIAGLSGMSRAPIRDVAADDGRLILEAGAKSIVVPADTCFETLKALADRR